MLKIKFELIPDWKKAWKYLSVITSAIGAVVCGVIEFYGQDLPPSIYSAFFVVVMISRLINQVDDDDNTN